MSESPKRLIRFWQELKRRKTGKVIVAYAATAFIVLQLADILTPALLLPEWTTRLVTLILIIGFPIAVIFSWVFDITPEGIRKTESVSESEKKTVIKPPKKILSPSNIIIAVLLVVVGILAYPKVFKRDTLERLRSSGDRISIAVMPFQNMTNDTILNYWQDGIQVNLITSLTNVKELRVRQIESINKILQSKGLTNYASITPSFASQISQKLEANVFISGSIIKAGGKIRINAQLINSKTEEAFKSFQINGSYENFIQIIDTLSVLVKDFLIVSILKKEVPPDIQKFGATLSPVAYRYFIMGQNAFSREDYPTAIEMYSQAVKIDSNFYFAALEIYQSFYNQGLLDSAKKWCLKVYKKVDQMSPLDKIWTKMKYADCFETPNEVIKYANQYLEIDDQQPIIYYIKGANYMYLKQYDKSIPECETSLEIYNKWDSKPMWANNYILLGYDYHKIGKLKKEKKLYKKAEHDFPDVPNLIYRQAILALIQKNANAANKLIEKYKSILAENSSSEADIQQGLGWIYYEAGVFDKAEACFHEAISLEPDDWRKNQLADFLINSDRNVKEGLGIAELLLKSNPNDLYLMQTKGWGLYKLRKYQEAFDLLQKSWDLRMKYAVYNHEAFLHLEAAKKAVASQKNN